ncbi:MAG: SulP family inorganic anion transporter [Bryobacter sp.]|nr:SulP family inorganic anion transporter [Bryobacter sp.]
MNLFSSWKNDLLASFVVFLVALPLCLGIAVASGFPPEMGIVTGIIGGLIVGALAGSPLQVSGPAAGLVVLVFEVVQEHGLAKFGLILMLAGLMQFSAGLLKVGHWFRAISPAVVYGLLAGIGILIMAGQFHVMVDDSPKGTGLENILSIPRAIFEGIFPLDGSAHEHAALTGLLTICVMLLWNKFRPEGLKFLPSALMGVVAAALASMTFGPDIKHVTVPDNLTASFHWLQLSTLSHLADWKYWVEAFAMAFIASAETLLSANAVDKMTSASGLAGVRTKHDQELRAQGIGNMLCAFIGALPMTGVIVRSSANVQAGARTRLSAILHGAWLLVAVLAIPHVLERIPTSALAAILVLTGWKLISVEQIRRLREYGHVPVVIYAGTVLGIVAFDLLTGVLIGIFLTFGKMVFKASRLKTKLTGHASGRSDLYLEGSATFLRLPLLSDTLDRVPPKSELHIHFEKLYYLDHSCLDLIKDWSKTHTDSGGAVVVDWDRLIERYTRLAL